MKQNRLGLLALGVALFLGTTACNNSRESGADQNPESSTDTNLTDTRRGTTDTINYITKDSGNTSQETIDMNPPQNSRY